MLSKILPLRQAKAPKIIADFDRLVSEPIGFRFHGREYVIKPVDTLTFMKTCQALSQVQELLTQQGQGKDVDMNEIYEGYHAFTEPLCPELTLKDLKSMALPQIHALIHLMINHLTGKTASDMVGPEGTEKKK